VVWWLRHCIAKLYEQQLFETYQGQGFGLIIFSVNIPGSQQQFENYQGQGFGLIIFSVKVPPRIFSVNIPRPDNSSGSSKIVFSTRPSWSSG
jgi:hypothetical protein